MTPNRIVFPALGNPGEEGTLAVGTTIERNGDKGELLQRGNWGPSPAEPTEGLTVGTPKNKGTQSELAGPDRMGPGAIGLE